MSIAIDVIFAAVVLLSVWRGYKGGLIRGVCGLLVLVLSIYGAHLIATAYSGEFTGMLKPFVGGVVDRVIADVTNDEGAEEIRELEKLQILPEGKGYEAYGVAYVVLRHIGISETAAENIAAIAAGDADGVISRLSGSIADRLSEVLAYVAVFGISFTLLAIVFAVIGNLINLVFSIPGLELLDAVAGALFGLARGLVLILIIALVVRYIGLLSTETVEQTVILKYFVEMNPVADILGV